LGGGGEIIIKLQNNAANLEKKTFKKGNSDCKQSIVQSYENLANCVKKITLGNMKQEEKT